MDNSLPFVSVKWLFNILRFSLTLAKQYKSHVTSYKCLQIFLRQRISFQKGPKLLFSGHCNVLRRDHKICPIFRVNNFEVTVLSKRHTQTGSVSDILQSNLPMSDGVCHSDRKLLLPVMGY